VDADDQAVIQLRLAEEVNLGVLLERILAVAEAGLARRVLHLRQEAGSRAIVAGNAHLDRLARLSGRPRCHPGSGDERRRAKQ